MKRELHRGGPNYQMHSLSKGFGTVPVGSSLTITPPGTEAPLSFLDPEETNVRSPQEGSTSDVRKLPCTLELTFRHSHWQRHRQAIYNALRDNYTPAARLERFAFCGSGAWVYRTTGDLPTYRVAGSNCHDRFCLPCQTARAEQLAAVLHSQLPDEALSFITLTIRRSTRPLHEQLTHLTASFRKLRSSKLWKSAVEGGVAFMEVKVSKDHQSWHPHLHIIAQARYIPQSDLAQNWHRITGDSYIVDIRRIDDHDKVRRYVTKYASKPLSYAPTNDPERLREAIHALRGRRLCFCFGSWRAFKLTRKVEPQEWTPIAPLVNIIKRANQGERFALAILAQLKEKKSCRPTSPKRSPPLSRSLGTCLSGSPDGPPVRVVEPHYAPTPQTAVQA